ncbi:hypothetical protein HDU96_002260, partial [Phlyctochytrium bullatum]
MAILGDNPEAEVEVGILAEDDDNVDDNQDRDNQGNESNDSDGSEENERVIPKIALAPAKSHDIWLYYARPSSLEHIYFAQMLEWYHLVKKAGTLTTDLTPDHHLYKKRHFAVNQHRHIFVLTGKYDKLPDIDGEDVDPEELETYYFILLILFYPHRKNTFPKSGSKKQAFEEWVAANPGLEAVKDAKKYMSTCRDFHQSNAGCQQYGPNDEEECLRRHPCKEDHPDQTERRNGYFEAIPELDSFGEDEEDNPLDELNLNLSIPESVELRLAYTGLAASQVDGNTLHSTFGITSVKNEPRTEHSAAEIAKHGKVKLIIIDEISMSDQTLIGAAHIAANMLADKFHRRVPSGDILFGGKDVMMFGDFMQFLPVGGSPIFKPPEPTTSQQRPKKAAAKNTNRKTANSDFSFIVTQAQGFRIYNAINFCVFLTENIRQDGDNVLTDCLRAVRADLNDVLKDKLIPNDAIMYYCMARKSPKANRKLDIRKGAKLPDCQTGLIPILQSFYVGMPIIFTRKLTAPKPPGMTAVQAPDPPIIAFKGTIATVVGVQLNEVDVNTQPTTSERYRKMYLNELPDFIIVQIRNETRVLYENFPPGCIPVTTVSLTKLTLTEPLTEEVVKRYRPKAETLSA